MLSFTSIAEQSLKDETKLPTKNTSCKELIKQSGDLSIHQLTAYHTILQVHKTTQTNKPDYLSKKLVLRKPDGVNIFPIRNINTIHVNRNLTVSRSGFIYRGASLWNKLPVELRSSNKLEAFRKGAKKWIMENVAVKP